MTTETFANIGATLLPENTWAGFRSQPGLVPREPPDQAMVVSRGSCHGRALRRPRMVHPVSHVSSHVHPYPRVRPEYEAAIQAPINCRQSRSKFGPFGFAAQD